MDHQFITQLIYDLLVVLAAGLLAGAVCRRLGVSMLAGYLVIGACLGSGVLGWVREESHELEYLAEAGVLLLLFSIGIGFSLAELIRMARPMLVGGSVQMVLVAAPVAGVMVLLGREWPAAVLLGAAVAFSSTVLVFKALEEWGHATSPHGRRAIAILLYQDAAIVPLILLVPLLTGQDTGALGQTIGLLAAKSAILLAAVPIGRMIIIRWLAPWLARQRSVELVVLFALVVLGGSALVAYRLGLPPVIGALGAGLMLNGNRLTDQIEAVVLPFRETFAAVFFVSLGTLIRFDTLLAAPWLCLVALAAVLLLKILAAATALRLAGLPWLGALGTGLGLGQIGEFAFVLVMTGLSYDVIAAADYELLMFVAIVTLILTPQMLKVGLRVAERHSVVEHEIVIRPASSEDGILRAVVVGAGPIGSRTASQLETFGYDVCLVDLSPINLHAFAQQGFRTVAGDASDQSVLDRADVVHSGCVVVTVPDDAAAMRVVAAVRRVNSETTLLVRCGFQATEARLRALGATEVLSAESELAGRLSNWLDRLRQT